MKKYKTTLPKAAAEGLLQIIERILLKEPETDDDKLLVATLAEVGKTLHDKLSSYETIKKTYTISFKPAQAIALRILSTDYETDITSYMGNHLRCMANQIHKQYN